MGRGKMCCTVSSSSQEAQAGSDSETRSQSRCSSSLRVTFRLPATTMSWLFNPDPANRNQTPPEEETVSEVARDACTCVVTDMHMRVQEEDYSGRKVSTRKSNQPFLA